MLRKQIIFALFRLDGANIASLYKKMKNIEFASKKELIGYQNREIQYLLDYAYKHVPYYFDLFNKIGIVNKNVVDRKYFDKIPPLTKEIIRKEGKRMYSDDIRIIKHYVNTSGGSTGEPIKIIQDFDYRDKSWANKILYCEMIGKQLGEKEIKLWGSERDIFQGSESYRSQLQNWIYNRRLLNSFRMTEKQKEYYIDEINKFKPVSIWAYIDSIYELARFIDIKGKAIHSPKTILVTAGTVELEIQRYIASIFNAPVYNQYGSREVGDMAVECPAKNGLHVFDYLYKFEILDKDLKSLKNNEIGEVYVTPLMNYVMPLIRYKIGDTASWSNMTKCSCGRNTPLINNVHGRVTNHFIKKDGTVVHGEYFTHLFYFRKWVKKFKVIQNDYNTIECLVVLDGKPDKNDEKDISQKIRLVMGKDCAAKFRYVRYIPPSKSGKYLYTESKIR